MFPVALKDVKPTSVLVTAVAAYETTPPATRSTPLFALSFTVELRADESAVPVIVPLMEPNVVMVPALA